MRLTLPIISMVITFLSLLLKISAGKWNTLVNFESASTRLSGQFSVGVNSQGHQFRGQPRDGSAGIAFDMAQ
jgi:hypothetical protein